MVRESQQVVWQEIVMLGQETMQQITPNKSTTCHCYKCVFVQIKEMKYSMLISESQRGWQVGQGFCSPYAKVIHIICLQ